MSSNGQQRVDGAGHALHFLAGLLAGGLAGAGAMLMLAPQSGEKTRMEIKNKGLELRDEAAESLTEAGQRIQEQAATWQEKGKGVTEALSTSKDSIVHAVNEGKDRVMAAVGQPNEPRR